MTKTKLKHTHTVTTASLFFALVWFSLGGGGWDGKMQQRIQKRLLKISFSLHSHCSFAEKTTSIEHFLPVLLVLNF